MEKKIKEMRANLFVDALILEATEKAAELGLESLLDLPSEKLHGVLLKNVRLFRGMSMSKLARASGVNKQTIYELERGLHKPHDTTIRKLADGLGVPESQLQPLKVFRFLPEQPKAVAEQIREVEKQASEEQEKAKA